MVMIRTILMWLRTHVAHLRAARPTLDRGIVTIETVIIAAATTALALGAVYAITQLVNSKLGELHL
jgi:hypothetical protein